MWPDRVSKLGPLALESDAPLIALRGPVSSCRAFNHSTVE